MQTPEVDQNAQQRPSAALTALMGTAAGAVATWAMTQVDWFMWRRLGARTRARTIAVRPGGEPPAQVLVGSVEKLVGLRLTPEQHHATGEAVHYMIGIAPAAGYALVRDKLPGRGTARGLLYGLGMFLVQDEALNTVTGLGAKPQDYPWQAHARGLVAHLVYGVVTELTLNAMEQALCATDPDAATARTHPSGRNGSRA